MNEGGRENDRYQGRLYRQRKEPELAGRSGKISSQDGLVKVMGNKNCAKEKMPKKPFKKKKREKRVRFEEGKGKGHLSILSG